jgi:serine/threonine protein kinase
MSETNPSRVEELLVEALDAAEVDGEQAIERICSAHPEHATQLRRRWKELERMGLLQEAPGSEMPERLGEFRLLRRLGGGGMGVVYLAVQEPLGREVALKLVRPDQLFLPGLRERFLREVQIVARLQHPGVVPIYTFGKAGGVPYFAMERVHGATLEELLNRLSGNRPEALDGPALGRALDQTMRKQGDTPEALDEWLYAGSWEEVCLRIMRLVADALAHVHARGVLHRDVKPSNIMLTPGGRVMLLDFGLAQGGGTDKLTRSATQLGSVPYLPPELLQGGREAASPRADVYSLGVSLYQALCLRLPYEGPTTTATMLSIAAGAAPAPRSRNSALSADAETVCLTAMEAAVERRYPSAEAFARDLCNVLERRPIDARRAGPMRRLLRWSQRHPARATAAALGLLILLGGPLGWAWQERRSNIALAAEGARSKRNLASALAAVDRLFTRVAEAELSRLPHMEGFRRALLGDALAFQQALLVDNASDPTLRVEQAQTHARIGRLQFELGKLDDAAAAMQTGLELVEATQAPDASRVVARLRVGQGEIALRRGTLELADSAAGTAIDLTAALLDTDPRDAIALQTYIDATNVRGRVAVLRGKLEEAAAHFRAGFARLERHDSSGPSNDALALSAAALGNEYGVLLSGQGAEGFGDHAEAERVLRATIERFEQRIDRSQPSQEYALTVLRSTHASTLLYLKRLDEAEIALDQNERVLMSLVARFPANVAYGESLAKLYNSRAHLAFELDRRTDVHDDLKKAIDVLGALVEAAPGSAEALSTLSIAETNLAAVEFALGRPRDALPLLEVSIRHGEAALALAPDSTVYRDRLAQHWFWMYDARRDTDDIDAAIDAMRNYARYSPGKWHASWEVAARMAELAGRLPADAAKRAERLDVLGGLAAQYLREARDRGCDEWPELAGNKHLAPLAETTALRELRAAPMN